MAKALEQVNIAFSLSLSLSIFDQVCFGTLPWTINISSSSLYVVFARRARGDRVEVWLGSDDTPEALAHIRGVLIQELTASGADELVRAAKYKKHFDGRREEKKQAKESQANGLQVPGGGSGSGSGSSPLPSPLPTTPMASGFEDKDTQALAQQQQEQRQREREQAKEQERIMQLGKERLEKERAEKDRLRDERVRAMAAAAMAAAEAKHQQQLQQQLEREQQQQ